MSRWIEDDGSLTPGDQIGPYRVEAAVGQGATGIVFRARHAATQQIAAVKVLRARFSQEPTLVDQFRHEVMTAQRLAHPAIARVLEWGETKGRCFYAMEYVNGKTVRELLHEFKRLPLDYTIQIGARVADALAYAFEAFGLLHLDVKPENLMVTNDQQVKVLDFGYAEPIRYLSRHSFDSMGSDVSHVDGFSLSGTTTTAYSTPGWVFGVPVYMAPEQLQGGYVLDSRADVYALGVVLYECLTGMTPYYGLSPSEVMRAQRENQVFPLELFAPGLPPKVNAIIKQALDLDVAQRIRNVHVLAALLQEAAQAF